MQAKFKKQTASAATCGPQTTPGRMSLADACRAT